MIKLFTNLFSNKLTADECHKISTHSKKQKWRLNQILCEIEFAAECGCDNMPIADLEPWIKDELIKRGFIFDRCDSRINW